MTQVQKSRLRDERRHDPDWLGGYFFGRLTGNGADFDLFFELNERRCRCLGTPKEHPACRFRYNTFEIWKSGYLAGRATRL